MTPLLRRLSRSNDLYSCLPSTPASITSLKLRRDSLSPSPSLPTSLRLNSFVLFPRYTRSSFPFINLPLVMLNTLLRLYFPAFTLLRVQFTPQSVNSHTAHSTSQANVFHTSTHVPSVIASNNRLSIYVLSPALVLRRSGPGARDGNTGLQLGRRFVYRH